MLNGYNSMVSTFFNPQHGIRVVKSPYLDEPFHHVSRQHVNLDDREFIKWTKLLPGYHGWDNRCKRWLLEILGDEIYNAKIEFVAPRRTTPARHIHLVSVLSDGYNIYGSIPTPGDTLAEFARMCGGNFWDDINTSREPAKNFIDQPLYHIYGNIANQKITIDTKTLGKLTIPSYCCKIHLYNYLHHGGMIRDTTRIKIFANGIELSPTTPFFYHQNSTFHMTLSNEPRQTSELTNADVLKYIADELSTTYSVMEDFGDFIPSGAFYCYRDCIKFEDDEIRSSNIYSILDKLRLENFQPTLVTPRFVSRLMLEFVAAEKIYGDQIWLNKDKINEIQFGPPVGTAWNTFTIFFGTDWPNSPPTCIAPMSIHCNISPSGKICTALLSDEWNPTYTLTDVCREIIKLMTNPPNMKYRARYVLN